MNETHGFSKQYDVHVCINEIISFHHKVVFGYDTWIFSSVFKSKVADQITEG